MSDDDDDRDSEVGGDAVDYQDHPRVYHVLRDFCDVPKLEYQCGRNLQLPRHGSLKDVVLVATLYHVYLFKLKGMKLYIRWPARFLSVCRRGASVYFSLGLTADSIADEHAIYVKKYGSEGRGKRRKGKKSSSRRRTSDSDDDIHHHLDDDDEDDDDDDGDVVASLDTDQSQDTFNACRIVCVNEGLARELVNAVTSVIYKSKSIAERHRREEEGKVKGPGVRLKLNTTEEDKDADEEEEGFHLEEDDDSEGSQFDGVDDAEIVVTRNTTQNANRAAATLLRNAPGRYIAVASLVDGEFADYTALKRAYMRNEDGSLLDDLKLFITENELQVEEVCRQHYPSFLHAAKQCTSITQSDAEVVRDQLSGATNLVRDSAIAMKQAASNLFMSRAVMAQMDNTHQQLRRLQSIAEQLETVETQVVKQQLLGAACMVKSLTSAAAQVAEFSVGDYILHRCIPRIQRRIVSSATAQLNRWLATLRQKAPAVGAEALVQLSSRVQQAPRVVAGRTSRSVEISDEQGGSWSVQRTFVPCKVTMPPTVAAMIPSGAVSPKGPSQAPSVARVLSEVIPEVIQGASVQRVFAALGLHEKFRKMYLAARWKQLEADLFPPLSSSMTQRYSTPEAAVDAIRSYCESVVGTLMLEDIVASAVNSTRVGLQSQQRDTATSQRGGVGGVEGGKKPTFVSVGPSMHSGADIARIWEEATRRIDALTEAGTTIILQGASGPLQLPGSQPISVTASSPPTSSKSDALGLLDTFAAAAVAVRCNLTSATVDPLLVLRVAERLGNRLQSIWVEDCCSECSMAIATDPFTPVVVNNLQEFDMFCGRFSMHRAIHQELPIVSAYKAGNVMLPYAVFVPTIGDRVLSLISRCYTSNIASEVNNFDDMMLEFLRVVFRTAASVLSSQLNGIVQRSGGTPDAASPPLALVASSCVAMTVIISNVEMAFLTRSSYGDSMELGRQVLGEPKLFASSAQLFRDVLSGAIDKLHTCLQSEAAEVLKPIGSLSYWKKRVSLTPKGNSVDSARDGTPVSVASTPSSSARWGQTGTTCTGTLLDVAERRMATLKVLLQPSVLRTIASFYLLQCTMKIRELLDAAIADNVYHENDMAMLHRCVSESRAEVSLFVPRFVQMLTSASSPPGASVTANGPPLRCSEDFDQVANDLEKLINAREIEIAKEKAKSNLDAVRGAGAAIVGGVADAGLMTGRTILQIGKSVKDGMGAAASAVVGK